MPHTLQPVLACDKGTASDITVFHSRAGEVYEVYIGIALLERVGTDPETVQRKMLVGRLHNAGIPLRELGEKFGHDARTVKKWAAAILTTDVDEMARAFAGRGGRGKITPEVIRYGRQLYRERARFGKNYRQVIIGKIEEVFCVRISSTTASEIFRLEKARGDPVPPPEKAATGEHTEVISGTEPGPPVKRSPTPLPVQHPGESRRPEEMIHHAGQALFANEMTLFSDPLQRQLIGQVLQGAVNVEQSKTLCGASLSNFTGPVKTVLKAQRDEVDRQAEPEAVLEVYRRNAELLADGPNRGKRFYFDPHTKEYTGQLAVLKGWCGRRHGVTKVLNLDCFHTQSGRPCFVRHHSPYCDMRERFFLALALFDQLFDPENRRGRTFVIDRGIYGLATLQMFDDDYVITWEKGYCGGGWDERRAVVAFMRCRLKNNAGDEQRIFFQCQQCAWRRDPSFRRIIARAAHADGDEIEVSVITSHPDMAVEDVVWSIFRRWLQENDFKYLDTHFGLNQLTSRDSLSFREQAHRFRDRPVDSPEYRELKATVDGLESRLCRHLLHVRKCRKKERELRVELARLAPGRQRLAARLRTAIRQLAEGRTTVRATDRIRTQARELNAARRKLRKRVHNNTETQRKRETEIAELQRQIDPLERRLCEAVRKQSRLQLLIDGDYRFLDTRKKSLMDALRISAANMFRNVQEQFRAIYDNFRDDHVLVRMLSRCGGKISATEDTVKIILWLPGTLQPYRVRAFEQLLDDIQQQVNNRIPPPYKRLHLTLAIGPLQT
jgi:hypothetical protein